MTIFERAWGIVKEEVDVYGNAPVEAKVQHPTYIRSDSTVSQMFGDGKPIDEEYTLLNVIIQYPRYIREEGHHMYGHWRNAEHERLEPDWSNSGDGDYFFHYPDGVETDPRTFQWEPVISPDTGEPQQVASGSYEYYSGDGTWYEDGSLEFRQKPDGVWELIDSEGHVGDFILDRLNARGYDVSQRDTEDLDVIPGYDGKGDHWKKKD